MTKQTIYFIFFNLRLSPDLGEKPFGLIHFLAIKSAKLVNDCDVFLYYENSIENNIWWEASKKYCTHISCKAPDEIFGNPLLHIAYKSDILRIQLLNELGGAYLDIDTISIKPIKHFFDKEFVMGQEMVNGEVLGLCNAVLIGKRGSEFGKLWLDEYKKNYDPRWGYMTIRRTHQLSLDYPDTISVEPPESFFKYTWTPEDLSKIHSTVVDTSGAYILHLWEQVSFTTYLQSITPESIRTTDTTYNLLARPFLE